MDVILQDYLKRFRAENELDKLSDDKVFESFAAYCLIRKYFEEDFEPDQFRVGGSWDLGIDAAAIMVNGALYSTPHELAAVFAGPGKFDVHLIIVQAKQPRVFSGATFAALATSLKHVFGGPPLTVRCSQEIRRLHECSNVIYGHIHKLRRMPKISVFYAAPGNPSHAVLDPPRLEATSRLEDTNRFGNVEMFAIGVSELRDLYLRAKEALNADLNTLNYMELPAMPHVDEAIIGVMTAPAFVDKVLANDSGQMRHALFVENLREFQQFDNEVNQEIQQTLQDNDRRQRFAVMNNGITIVARSLKKNGKQLHLKDLKIVNGCQTSYVLMYERPNLTEDVQVTVRIIVTRDPDAISDVIRSTNRQTVVRGIEFESRKAFHRLIEQFFVAQEPTKRLYYERRTGQFANRSVPDEASIPSDANFQGIQRTRIIRPKQLARAFSSVFLNDAWRTSQLSDEDDSKIFDRVIDPMPYYASAAILYRVEYLLRNRKIPQAYAAAKFHLMAAARLRLLGDDSSLSSGPKRTRACETILDLMWEPAKAELFFDQLTGVLTEARNAVKPHGDSEFDGALVSSKSFGDHVKRLTLATR
jgi:hypothetical protein